MQNKLGLKGLWSTMVGVLDTHHEKAKRSATEMMAIRLRLAVISMVNHDIPWRTSSAVASSIVDLWPDLSQVIHEAERLGWVPTFTLDQKGLRSFDISLGQCISLTFLSAYFCKCCFDLLPPVETSTSLKAGRALSHSVFKLRVHAATVLSCRDFSSSFQGSTIKQLFCFLWATRLKSKPIQCMWANKMKKPRKEL